MPEAFDLKRKREVIKGKTDFNSQRLAKERKKEQNKKKKRKKKEKRKEKRKGKDTVFFSFFFPFRFLNTYRRRNICT